MAPVSSPRAQSGIQTLSYDVYAGGIHAVEAIFTIDMRDPARYSMLAEANTRGFLRSLAPWDGTFETEGWVLEDGTLQPELHKSTAIWRDELDVKEYFYNSDGSFKGVRITDAGRAPQDRDIDPELTNGTSDIMTAVLNVMRHVSTGADCTGESEVFDGKRRFKVMFNQKERMDLAATKYNVFQGPAVNCSVEVIPVAGAWHKKPRGWFSIQEQGRERGTMPTIWMGQLDLKGGPAVPIKILVKTKHGALFMHLTKYQNGDRLFSLP